MPNHSLHGNRCSWLRSKQNPKEGRRLPFWIRQPGTETKVPRHQTRLGVVAPKGPSYVFSPWEAPEKGKTGPSKNTKMWPV